MHILVVGNSQNLDECQQKFGVDHRYERIFYPRELEYAALPDVVFDFLTDRAPLKFSKRIETPYFIDATQMSLTRYQEEAGNEMQFLFGFAGLPTFLTREVLEVTCKQEHAQKLEQVCSQLKTVYQIVADRVGLVTPRVICMIINEAYFTLQEGIATREDIDLAMKLGTNYPKGPFEWCRQIGIRRVLDLLETVYADTKDGRYRVCPLLRTESLQN